METEEKVYIVALSDSLKKKRDILQKLLDETKSQKNILESSGRNFSEISEMFEKSMDEKDVLLNELREVDRGFDILFEKVKDVLKQKKYQYKSRIEEMQQFIKDITDLGMSIEEAEKNNKDLFQAHINHEKKRIGMSRTSNQSAVSYYKNMPNQHKQWQTYFVDEKN